MNYNIYLITDPMYSLKKTITAMKAGTNLVQLREKNISSKDFYNKALEYKKLCKQYDTKLIINDRIDIALAVDADGLHIGQDDLDLKICKKLFPNKIIGVSVTNLKEAITAQENGATYIGVGAMFQTTTKSDAKYVTLSELEEIKKQIKIPIVCIGGINLENAKSLLEYNIDGLAICSEILSHNNPDIQVTRFKKIFN